METLTVRDIAEHIQRDGESLTSAVDRLRNWTDVGIIKAIGDKHPGTGRKKQYSRLALLQAVLLQALSDALGSPAVSLSELIHHLPRMVQAGALLWKPDELVVLSRSRGSLRVDIIESRKLGQHIAGSDLDVHIVVDLRHLFKGLLPDDLLDLFPRTRAALESAKQAKPKPVKSK